MADKPKKTNIVDLGDVEIRSANGVPCIKASANKGDKVTFTLSGVKYSGNVAEKQGDELLIQPIKQEGN